MECKIKTMLFLFLKAPVFSKTKLEPFIAVQFGNRAEIRGEVNAEKIWSHPKILLGRTCIKDALELRLGIIFKKLLNPS